MDDMGIPPENNENWYVETDKSISISNYIGENICILISGDINNFWTLTCPCGKTVSYPLNRLPEVDTLMPCGNPKHWVIKYKKEVRNEEI